MSEMIKINGGMINFKCLGAQCEKNCCGPFHGVNKTIEAIRTKGFHNIYLTPEDKHRLIQNGYGLYIDKDEHNRSVIKLNNDTSCTAFCNGKCLIHSIKPSLCKAYPFYIDMFSGLCGIVEECPGFGAGWTPVDKILKDISASIDIYQFWLDDIKEGLKEHITDIK